MKKQIHVVTIYKAGTPNYGLKPCIPIVIDDHPHKNASKALLDFSDPPIYQMNPAIV